MPHDDKQAADKKATRRFYDKHFAGVGLSLEQASDMLKDLHDAFVRGESAFSAGKAKLKAFGYKQVDGRWKKADAAPKKEAAKAPEMEAAEVDRKQVVAALEDLRRGGAKVEYDRAADDAVVRAALHAVLRKFPAAPLARVDDPEKLKLVGDCQGVWIDVSTKECCECPTLAACSRKFAQNAKDGFPAVVAKLKSFEKPGDDVVWEPRRMLAVPAIQNPNKPGSEGYEFVQAILDHGSMSMSRLRKVASKHFRVDEDEAFVAGYVRPLLQAEILILPEDLPADQVAEMGPDVLAFLGIEIGQDGEVRRTEAEEKGG